MRRPLALPLLLAAATASTIAAVGVVGALRGGAEAAGAVRTHGVTGVVDVNTNLAYEGASAAGTGIVLPVPGEVLTNNHVVRGATTIRVTDIRTGRSYAADVVGYDVSADIALLSIKGAHGPKAADLGDSATVKVGDAVTAVGNAGGVGGASATRGHVTGVNQSITVADDHGGQERLHGLIKASAPLQPGDSGGPLLNGKGQVVGMDTAASFGFAFQEQGSNGFAIPIDEATAVAKQIAAGRASATVHIGPTAFLGVDVAPAGGTGPAVTGALVRGVIRGSAADRARLLPGDVITSLAGRKVASATALTTALLRVAPGEKVLLGWLDPAGGSHTRIVRPASGPPQ